MFDENKPIEYHYEYRTWCEAVLISYSSHVYVLKFLMPGTADCWVQMTATSKYFDKIRNVESTEMFDKDKPIEYHYNNTEWREAVFLDYDFNGSYLIKYRKSPTSTWHSSTVSIWNHRKIRNVPEKLKYHVVVIKDVGTPCIWSSTVSKAYSIGDELNGGTVVAYHEGEYTK